ncbi:MAG: hydrogenase maturation protease [Thiotrichaceae bacterium]
MTHPFRIIGIGSAYGDDQLGWQIVEQLQATLPADIPVDLLICASPASELLGLMAHADTIILVDAVHSGTSPLGHFHCWQELAQLPHQGLSSHGVDIATMLQLAEILGQLQHWKLYGVEIGLEYLNQINVPLSQPITATIPKLIDNIQQDITDYLQTLIPNVDSTI